MNEIEIGLLKEQVREYKAEREKKLTKDYCKKALLELARIIPEALRSDDIESVLNLIHEKIDHLMIGGKHYRATSMDEEILPYYEELLRKHGEAYK